MCIRDSNMMGHGGMPPPRGPGHNMPMNQMMAKRQRFERNGMPGPGVAVRAGGGGIRGTSSGVSKPGGGGIKHGSQYRNGGPAPPPDPGIMQNINDAASPTEILMLWSDVSQAWEEAHLGHGLLRLAILVTELCPEEAGEVRPLHAVFRHAACMLPRHVQKCSIVLLLIA